MKYTIIYNDRWQSGSDWHCKTGILRVEKRDDETFEQFLDRWKIEEPCFVFVGWPKMLGEEE